MSMTRLISASLLPGKFGLCAAATVAETAGVEQLQHGQRADEIDDGVEDRDIDEFGAPHDIAMEGDAENHDGADGVHRQQPVESCRAAHCAHKRHQQGDSACRQSNREHHPADPPSRAVTLRSMSPLSTSAMKDGSRAWTTKLWPDGPSPSISMVTVPGVSVIEFA